MNSPTYPIGIDRLQLHESRTFIQATRYIERREPASPDTLVPLKPSVWNETELNDAILTLCDEIPAARMAACWRAREHCRQSTPRGTLESLLSEMRVTLRRDVASHGSPLAVAA